MANKKASDNFTPNPWDTVCLKKGMLTDDLARNVVHKDGGGGVSSKLTTAGNLGVPKVYKKPPNKFK